MMKAILPAILLSLFALTSANAAAPQSLGSHSAPALAQDASSLLVEVQHRHGDKRYHGKRHHGKQHHGKRHRYKPGSRHRAAPRHWRRHSKRPGDWRRRGCVIVGPVWFCP